jgi:hypothetical protein
MNDLAGVYVKSATATAKGGHAVALVGWGEEGGVPYWLIQARLASSIQSHSFSFIFTHFFSSTIPIALA